MNAEIISIGTELLMGETVDTNSSYLAGELAKIGIDLIWATKVGDHPGRLEEAARRAWERSDVTLTTGGLGPTSDDLTRESIAAVMGEKMEVQDDLLARLRAQFEERGIRMPETNVKQATLIPSAEVIPNPMGTAPGWWIERDGRVIAAMPGPPREISRMWESEVAPRLRRLNPAVAIATRTLKTFGVTEGGLDETLAPLFESENPNLGIYSKSDGIHLRAIARARTESEARALIAPMESAIRRAAGYAVWGEDDDTPAAAALAALRSRGMSLAVAEGFTGGMIASAVLSEDGGADALTGSITLGAGTARLLGADESRIASPSPTADDAIRLAQAVKSAMGADAGLAITALTTAPTDESGPAGTTHIGIAIGNESLASSGHYPTRRLRIRERAATHALLELARALETGKVARRERWG